ncbi:uncharacterized protein isoform X2 [Salmo salar]|uniref:Uncharacterized protein isoform X2 n=1 Tax=Salmo salar TaxID=8030 RepID=A0ABM3EG57_SALSA|nr:uncharacterized protein LOC123723932 isoform X2 [Salmo salar]
MASVKLEDCSQTLELNVNIKDEEEEEKIRKSVSHGRLELNLRPVTSIVRTNPACLSSSTLSPNLQSLGPDCDSGAQFALQDSEMASVKLEDCSQTLELNVNIKDEEEEEKIGTSVSHGKSVKNKLLFTLTAYPRPNPDDAGPIVRRPMGLPIMAGCDTAWLLTLVIDTMLRHPLHPECNSRKITELSGLTPAHIVRRFSHFYQS